MLVSTASLCVLFVLLTVEYFLIGLHGCPPGAALAVHCCDVYYSYCFVGGSAALRLLGFYWAMIMYVCSFR